MAIKRAFLLRSRLLRWWSKGFSTLIWTIEISIKGLFYFNLDCSWNGDQRAFLLRSKLFLKWWLKGFSISIWICWNVDQMAFLLRSELLKCRSKGFSTSIWTIEISIKGLFYFNLDCWNINQRAFLLWSGLLKYRSKGFSTNSTNAQDVWSLNQ